jgi:putative flippase GtrA
MDVQDIIKIIAIVVLVPIIFYLKRRYKSDDSGAASNRSRNFCTAIAVSLILALSMLSILKYTSLGPKSVLLIPILGIVSCVVVVFYLSKR